jgi:hypothetical protein
LRKKFSDYIRDAKASGIKLALAYVCSTSIVKLETFDKNWSKEFRAQFATPPLNGCNRIATANRCPLGTAAIISRPA